MRDASAWLHQQQTHHIACRNVRENHSLSKIPDRQIFISHTAKFVDVHRFEIVQKEKILL